MTSRALKLLEYWGTAEKAVAMAQAQQKRNALLDKDLAIAIRELKSLSRKAAKENSNERI